MGNLVGQSKVQVKPDKLEMEASFCYLGDVLSADGGCELVITTRVKKKFRELLPVLTSCHLLQCTVLAYRAPYSMPVKNEKSQ